MRPKMTIVPARVLLAVGLAGFLGAALCACATQSPRTAEERAQDAVLAQQVEAALSADPRIYARHVDVTSDRGVITLSGLIWSNEEYVLAKRDAALVPGVVRVDSSMDLVRGGISGTSR
jgi:osmotically-inducible protein OsmY